MRYAMNFVGARGHWGGDGPYFDCSGFVQEVLRGAGRYPRDIDRTAHELRQHYAECATDKPIAGCLVFFWSQTDHQRVAHVGFCISETQYIGAEGVMPGIDTEVEAIKSHAFVCIRDIDSRPRCAGFVDPFMKQGV